MSESYPSPDLPPQPTGQTNSLAVISLVMGLLGLSFLPLLGSIAAVIVGPMARKEIANSGGAQGGDGLATAGVVLGWIGIALGVIGLCLAVLALLIALFGISSAVRGAGQFWLPPVIVPLF